MTRRRFSPAVAALLVLAGVALVPARSSQAAHSLLFRAKFVLGTHYSEVHANTTVTRITATITSGGQSQPLVQNSTENDRYLVTTIVREVHADGSALLRFTFGKSSVTADGKTIGATLNGYYREQYLDTSLHLISQRVVGLNTVPAALRDALPKLDIPAYPAKTLAAGDSWTSERHDAHYGTLKIRYTLKQLGNWQGRETATIHASAAAPIRVTSNGLVFSGTLIAADDASYVVATGQNAIPSHSRSTFTGTLSGSANGAKVQGTFIITSNASISPQS